MIKPVVAAISLAVFLFDVSAYAQSGFPTDPAVKDDFAHFSYLTFKNPTNQRLSIQFSLGNGFGRNADLEIAGKYTNTGDIIAIEPNGTLSAKFIIQYSCENISGRMWTPYYATEGGGNRYNIDFSVFFRGSQVAKGEILTKMYFRDGNAWDHLFNHPPEYQSCPYNPVYTVSYLSGSADGVGSGNSTVIDGTSTVVQSQVNQASDGQPYVNFTTYTLNPVGISSVVNDSSYIEIKNETAVPLTWGFTDFYPYLSGQQSFTAAESAATANLKLRPLGAGQTDYVTTNKTDSFSVGISSGDYNLSLLNLVPSNLFQWFAYKVTSAGGGSVNQLQGPDGQLLKVCTNNLPEKTGLAPSPLILQGGATLLIYVYNPLNGKPQDCEPANPQGGFDPSGWHGGV